jgi:hypothetical protein
MRSKQAATYERHAQTRGTTRQANGSGELAQFRKAVVDAMVVVGVDGKLEVECVLK